MPFTKVWLCTLSLTFLSFFAGPFAFGQTTNPKISIQGTLKKASGEPVDDGYYRVTFKLYNDMTAGSVVWQETSDSVEVNGGIYSHSLGSVTALTTAAFMTTAYLGVKVGTYEMTPRTEITYAPYAFAVYSAICSGAVGDVKFSILNPTQFAAENGNCWVPLDGRSISGSRLNTYLSSIPNAGGMFLRAQDFGGGYGQNSSDNDPDRSHASAIAAWQGDSYAWHNHGASVSTDGSHYHGYQDSYYSENNGSNDGWTGSGKTDNDNTSPYNNPFTVGRTTEWSGSHSHTVNVQHSGSNETRPKNLNLWIYIRIN